MSGEFICTSVNLTGCRLNIWAILIMRGYGYITTHYQKVFRKGKKGPQIHFFASYSRS